MKTKIDKESFVEMDTPLRRAGLNRQHKKAITENLDNMITLCMIKASEALFKASDSRKEYEILRDKK